MFKANNFIHYIAEPCSNTSNWGLAVQSKVKLRHKFWMQVYSLVIWIPACFLSYTLTAFKLSLKISTGNNFFPKEIGAYKWLNLQSLTVMCYIAVTRKFKQPKQQHQGLNVTQKLKKNSNTLQLCHQCSVSRGWIRSYTI